MILLQQQILSNLKDKRFIFTVNTTNTSVGSSAVDEFNLPLVAASTVNALVSWGDGTSDLITSWNQAEVSHRYDTQGIYEVTMDGVVNGWHFNDSGDRNKILNIYNWGSFDVSISHAFFGCSNLDTTATDYPVISISDGLIGMFENCFSLTTLDVSNWDVSSVSNLRRTFFMCGSLTTLDVANWDVSSVSNLRRTFFMCGSLTTLDVANWDVSSVSSLQDTFFRCSSLTTLDVTNWNVSSVTIMLALFHGCRSLTTLDVSNWDVSSVTTMERVFFECASLTTLDVANWDINQVIKFINFMAGAFGLSTLNYDATLISWTAQAPTSGLSINFGGSQYTLGGAAAIARQELITVYNWTITDGGGV